MAMHPCLLITAILMLLEQPHWPPQKVVPQNTNIIVVCLYLYITDALHQHLRSEQFVATTACVLAHEMSMQQGQETG